MHKTPMAFFTHWFAIAVLVSIYWDDMPYPQRFAACFAFYAVANCASTGAVALAGAAGRTR